MSFRKISQLLADKLQRPARPANAAFEKLFGQKINICEDIIGHRVRSRMLFAEALNTAKDQSAAEIVVDGQRVSVPSNMRLATYGDSVIQTHLCRLWLFKGPDACEHTASLLHNF
jgi:hypothetical protein